MQEAVIEFVEHTGPRYLENGANLDADIFAFHPVTQDRLITDPVSDGSLGQPGYEPGQHNKDGSLL